MSIWLILAIAALTYGSRAVALVAMPMPSTRVRAILDRIPAPLFASLAAISLFEHGEPAASITWCAALGAVIAAPTRSLLWVLVAGVVGYAIGALVL
ncbi:MAG: AzlD domain-containing protein [Actinomycetota bacterium]